MKHNITRERIVFKINNYLEGEVGKEEISKWALNIVIDSEFNEIAKRDKLLAESICALASLHDENEEFNTPNEVLKYYRDRLEEDRLGR